MSRSVALFTVWVICTFAFDAGMDCSIA